VSPNGKLFAVLGDHEDGCIVDPKCGKVSELFFFLLLVLQGTGLYGYISMWLILIFNTHIYFVGNWFS